MRVLFDYQAFEFQKIGGVSRYFSEVMRSLRKYADVDLGLVATDNVYLHGYPRLDSFRYRIFRKLHRSNIECSLRKLRKRDFDVFHPTYFSTYFLDALGNKPMVLTIHDMISELYEIGGGARQSELKRQLVERADHIVAVSENTKTDLMRLFSVPEGRITVIYHGSDQSEVQESHPIFNGQYVLFVGSRWSYKGFEQFMKDMVPILRRRAELYVICTGTAFSESELKLIDSLGIRGRVIQHFAADDLALQNLFSHAVAFVYPSEYEGFGLPILEAYRARCPVILRKASCFPEIAGEAAIFFGSSNGRTDFEEKFEGLYQMTNAQRKALLDAQTARLKLFNWETAARKLAKVYEGVVR